MVRTVNEAAHQARRNAILDTAEGASDNAPAQTTLPLADAYFCCGTVIKPTIS